MPIFTDDQDIEATFQTATGPIGVLAEVRIIGRTLDLHDPAVFPRMDPKLDVGIRQILAIVHEVMELARLEGYESIFVDGHRISGATPGRTSVIRRRL